MRKIIQVFVLMAIVNLLSGCVPLVCAGIAVALPLISRDVQHRKAAQRTELTRQNNLRQKAEKKARIEKQRLVRRRAEMFRRQREIENRRKREQEERDMQERQQLASLPTKAVQHASTLAEVRRELGQIAKEATDTRKRLLQTELKGSRRKSPGKEQYYGNQ